MTKLFRTTITGLGLVLGLAASGTTANAAFTAHFDGVGSSTSVHYSTNSGVSWGNTTAGLFNWTQTGVTDVPFLNHSFGAFCIDLGQTVQTNQTFTPGTLASAPLPGGGMGTTKAAALNELFNEHYADISSNGALGYQAFQVAVWNIVWDGDTSVSSGTFRVSAPTAVVNLANTWLATINGTLVQNGPVLNLVALKTENGQDMVTILKPGYDDGGNLQPVPAPPALVLALVGIVPCLAMRRRLRAQAA